MSDPESAIAAYRQVMEAKPGSQEAQRAHFGIAETYYKRMDDHQKGLEVYEEVTKAYPRTEVSGEANWAIGMHYFQAKDYEKAREKFAKVTEEIPGTTKADDAARDVGDGEHKAIYEFVLALISYQPSAFEEVSRDFSGAGVL